MGQQPNPALSTWLGLQSEVPAERVVASDRSLACQDLSDTLFAIKTIPEFALSLKIRRPSASRPSFLQRDRRGMQLEVIGIQDGPWGTRKHKKWIPRTGPGSGPCDPGSAASDCLWSWDQSPVLGLHRFQDWSKPVPGSSPGVTAIRFADTSSTSNLQTLVSSNVAVSGLAPTALFLGPAQRHLGANRPVRSLTDELPSVWLFR